MSGSASLNGSSGIAINGSGAKFLQTSSTAVAPLITLTQGTIDGTGTVGNVTVASLAGNTVANGNGGTTPLNFSNLSFSGSATASLSLAGTSAGLVVSSALTTTGAGGLVTVNATNSSGWVTGTTYNLINFGTFSGSLSDFSVGNIGLLSARQSATLGNSGTAITLAIAGQTPYWNGQQSDWLSANAWTLNPSGSLTTFLTGDNDVFDDSAGSGTFGGTLLTNSGNVTPISVIFNNNSLAYTLSGAFGITNGTAGSTFLVKNGTGSLTIGNSNSYTGGTTLNNGVLNANAAGALGNGSLMISGGTLNANAAQSVSSVTLNAGALNIGGSNALGSGTFTIAGGTLDNTSGGSLTVASNNAQNWSGSFTFGGSSPLNLGTGAVTLSASTTVAVSGSGALTVAGAIGGGFGLSKSGSGTLILTGTNSYSGGTTVNSRHAVLGQWQRWYEHDPREPDDQQRRHGERFGRGLEPGIFRQQRRGQ